MNKMASRVFSFCLIVFTTFGLFAYLSLGDMLKDQDLFPERPKLPKSKDTAMTILKISKVSPYI